MTDYKTFTKEKLLRIQKEYGPTCKDIRCCRCENNAYLPTCEGCVEYTAIVEELQRRPDSTERKTNE